MEPTARTRRLMGLFLWGSWGLLVLLGLVYVWKYGSNVPYWDDWLLVPALVAEDGPTLQWVWDLDNEHRIPLARLALYALIRLGGVDFRIPMYAAVLLLAALALGLLRLASRVRGRPALSDVLIPLLLLHVGHCENLLWSWQLAHVLTASLVGTLLLLVLRYQRERACSTAILTGLVLAALPLSGAPGIAYVPALSLWIICLAVRSFRSQEPHARRDGLVALGAAALGPGVIALYFMGESVTEPRAVPDLGTLRHTLLQFLSLGFGPGLRELGEFPIGLLVAGFTGVSVALLAYTLWRRPAGEFLRPLGLLLLFAGFVVLALGVGLRRPGSGNQPYYALYAAPALLLSYFVWDLWGGSKLRPVMRTALVLLASGALWFNTWQGVDYGRIRRARMERFEADLQAGLPVHVLLARHTQTIWPLTEAEDSIAASLFQMREAGIGAYGLIQDNPPFQTVALDLTPTETERCTWFNGQVTGEGRAAYLAFTLDKPRYVAGVEIECIYEGPHDPVLRVAWKPKGQGAYPEAVPFVRALYAKNWTLPEHPSIIVWVGEEISEFRIYPDMQPFRVRISRIGVIVPADALP